MYFSKKIYNGNKAEAKEALSAKSHNLNSE